MAQADAELGAVGDLLRDEVGGGRAGGGNDRARDDGDAGGRGGDEPTLGAFEDGHPAAPDRLFEQVEGRDRESERHQDADEVEAGRARQEPKRALDRRDGEDHQPVPEVQAARDLPDPADRPERERARNRPARVGLACTDQSRGRDREQLVERECPGRFRIQWVQHRWNAASGNASATAARIPPAPSVATSSTASWSRPRSTSERRSVPRQERSPGGRRAHSFCARHT